MFLLFLLFCMHAELQHAARIGVAFVNGPAYEQGAKGMVDEGLLTILFERVFAFFPDSQWVHPISTSNFILGPENLTIALATTNPIAFDTLVVCNLNWKGVVWTTAVQDVVAGALVDNRLQRLLIYDSWANYEVNVPGIPSGYVRGLMSWHYAPYNGKVNTPPSSGPAGTVGQIHGACQLGNGVISPDLLSLPDADTYLYQFRYKAYLWGQLHPEQSMNENWDKYGGAYPMSVEYCYAGQKMYYSTGQFFLYMNNYELWNQSATGSFAGCDSDYFDNTVAKNEQVPQNMINLFTNELAMILAAPPCSAGSSKPRVYLNPAFIQAKADQSFVPVYISADPSKKYRVSYVGCFSSQPQASSKRPDCFIDDVESQSYTNPLRQQTGQVIYVRSFSKGPEGRLYRITFQYLDVSGTTPQPVPGAPMYSDVCVLHDIGAVVAHGLGGDRKSCPNPDGVQWIQLDMVPVPQGAMVTGHGGVQGPQTNGAVQNGSQPAAPTAPYTCEPDATALYAIVSVVVLALVTLLALVIAVVLTYIFLVRKPTERDVFLPEKPDVFEVPYPTPAGALSIA